MTKENEEHTAQAPDQAVDSGSIDQIKKKYTEGKEKLNNSWNRLIGIFRQAYQTGIKISIAIGMMLIVYQSIVDMFDDKVVFESFVVPMVLEEKGYTGTFLVQKITDQISHIREQVRKSDQEKFIKIEAMEQSTHIQVPGTGLSLKQVTDFIRVFLGTSVRSVSGNVMMITDDQLFLTVWAPDRPGFTFTGNLQDIITLIKPAAEYIL